MNFTVGDRVIMKDTPYRQIRARQQRVKVTLGEAIVVWNNPLVPAIALVFENSKKKQGPKFHDRDDIEKVVGHLSLEELLTHPVDAVREAGLRILANETQSVSD